MPLPHHKVTICGIPELPQHVIDAAVRLALAEDLGLAGDLTSQSTLPPEAVATAAIVTREAGVIAGLPLAAAVKPAVCPATTV